MSDILIGATATASTIVTEQNTAQTMKSGSLPVFATPAMCALMEEAAQAAVSSHLELGQGTVGTHLSISHVAASPLGAVITATATVTAVEGRKITFHLTAHDATEEIGNGTHERFIISNDKFMEKVMRKG